MQSYFWKRYDDKKYSFDDALNIVLANNGIQMRVDDNGLITLDKDNIPNDIDNISIPFWSLKSNNWCLYIPDNDLNSNLYDLQDWVSDLSQTPDSRFYDIDNMDAFGILNWIFNSSTLINDPVSSLKILNFIKDNNLVK